MASQDTAPLKDSYNDAPPAYSPPMNQQQQGYGAAQPQNYPPNGGYAQGESRHNGWVQICCKRYKI